jgi:hypothetical protein
LQESALFSRGSEPGVLKKNPQIHFATVIYELFVKNKLHGTDKDRIAFSFCKMTCRQAYCPAKRPGWINLTTKRYLREGAVLWIVTLARMAPAAAYGFSATSIRVDPSAPAKIYTGIDNHGIYRSTDSGGSWTAATTRPANTHIWALAINTSVTSTLYAGTYGGG